MLNKKQRLVQCDQQNCGRTIYSYSLLKMSLWTRMTESQSTPAEAACALAGVRLGSLPAISKSGAPPTCSHCSGAGGGREARLKMCLSALRLGRLPVLSNGIRHRSRPHRTRVAANRPASSGSHPRRRAPFRSRLLSETRIPRATSSQEICFFH